jgi:hypothetical protein
MSQQVNLEAHPLKTWPEDWDIHVLKTCNLYFEEEEDDVQFLTGSTHFFTTTEYNGDLDSIRSSIDIFNIDIRLMFKYHEKYYSTIFRMDENINLIGIIFRNHEMIYNIDPEEDSQDTPQVIGHGIFMVQPIHSIKAFNAYECVQTIEDIILNDSWDDDNDNNDNIDPINPVLDLELEPLSA